MSVMSLLTMILVAAIPLSLVIAALIVGVEGRLYKPSEVQRWRLAWIAVVAVSAATVVLIGFSFMAALPIAPADTGRVYQTLSDLFSLDLLRLSLLVLLSVMGLVVVKFSKRYLSADPAMGRYLRWLLLTLAAVALVFISNHLLLFASGWIAISLSLHQLLMFFPERPRAALGAHKKFLLARVAEISLLTAFWLLWQHHGTTSIDEIIAAYVAPVDLSWEEQIAAVLIAATALIKCAQLPVHGWLIQVVEAPTPVSALLHAGVINLGGFLLILFAPLFLQVAAAQWLVLVTGGLTTVLAALIMTKRISIKVRLAWSTSAQMGLMLVECALGLIELALLHLFAHSAYKAHAFLTTGSEVQQHVRRSMVVLRQPGIRHWVLALIPAFTVTATASYGSYLVYSHAQPLSVWLLLGLALTALIAMRSAAVGWFSSLVLAVAVAVAYVALKALLTPVAGDLHREFVVTMFSAPDLWVLALFAVLFSLWWVLRWRAQWLWVERLSTALFAGLYLDEWFTRTTLRIWPARLPRRANPKRAMTPDKAGTDIFQEARQ